MNLSKTKRGGAREFIGPYNQESQVVALVLSMAGPKNLDDVIET